MSPPPEKALDEGWSTRPTFTAAMLTQTWRPHYNVGVRCGHWSCPQPGMGLVVLDIDITPQAEHSEPFDFSAVSTTGQSLMCSPALA